MKALTRSRASCLALAAILTFAVAMGFGRLPAADPDPEPQPPALVAIETFKGRLHLRWKPVRPDPKYVSLTKNKGKLTITTQRGSIHGDGATQKDLPARNIYLIDNPLPGDADFEVTTCISGFAPRKEYQQAALILYNDDDNDLKWSYEFSYVNGGSVALGLIRETAAKTQHDHIAPPDGADKKLWLRLTRRKNSYEYASSADGKTFTTHGEREWGDKGPARLGILAKNGGPAGVPEVDVCFERFELRSPPSPMK
jgi:regulation of enolase protein 1 (concanavalin A-like superfamily)